MSRQPDPRITGTTCYGMLVDMKRLTRNSLGPYQCTICNSEWPAWNKIPKFPHTINVMRQLELFSGIPDGH